GQSAGVPMIIGNTHDETRAFMGGDPGNFTVGWDALPARLTQAAMRVDIDPATVIAEYRRLYPGYSPSDVLFSATHRRPLLARRDHRGRRTRQGRDACLRLSARLPGRRRAAARAPRERYPARLRQPGQTRRHGERPRRPADGRPDERGLHHLRAD